MRGLILFCALFATASTLPASSVYIGHSGAPGRLTCAMSCHGSGDGTVVISGFPQQYAPGQTYTVSIYRASGQSISNFNASCRVGTGTTNAGLIAAGFRTATYFATNETNGVHFASANQDSGTFLWTAPEAGTGTVRLYVGAHQRPGSSGANTTIVAVAAEEQSGTPPGTASNPLPPDSATDVMPDVTLSWTAGSDAAVHDVYFGPSNPPDSVTSQADTTYTPATALLPGTTYYWRIDERNDAGTTPGPVWSFAVLDLPDTARNILPADGATDVALQPLFAWHAAAGAVLYRFYMGQEDSLFLVATAEDTSFTLPYPLEPNEEYLWRIDAVNELGATPGTMWSFVTTGADDAEERPAVLPARLELGPLYPNPFNATVTIPFALSAPGNAALVLYDVTGREVAVIARGQYAAGNHRMVWSAEGVGSGIYLLRLDTGSEARVAKVVMVK